MKILKIILALFVATAWADCRHPLGFFAKFNNSMIPLYGQRRSDFKFLIHSNELTIPTKFIFRDGYAFTECIHGREYVGFNHSMLIYGTSVPKTRLKLHSTMRIDGLNFTSCIIKTDASSPINAVNPGSICLRVDIYLVPFDEDTGLPVRFLYSPEGNRNVFSDTKFYLLAKVNGKMFPLSSICSHENNNVKMFLLTRWGMKPTAIPFLENKTSPQFGNIGIFEDRLGYGAIDQVPMDLDDNKKVRGRRFYACDGLSNGYGNLISSYHSDETCFPVEIYFMRDGIKRYNAEETASITYSDNDKSVNENLGERIDKVSVILGRPLIFYANVNNKWYILSPFQYPEAPNITWFSLKRHNDRITRITFQDNYASTGFGNVGFFNGNLVYGSGINQTKLKLNPKGKVKNHHFFACKGLYNYFGNVISLTKTDQTCFKVSIYLKKFELRKMNVPWSEMPWLRNSSSLRLASQLIYDKSWLEDSDEENAEKNNTDLKNLESRCSYSDPESPSVFYVNANDSLIPLSHRSHFGGRSLRYGKFPVSPAMFTFKNSYVFKCKTFVIVWNRVLDVGPNDKKTRFELDENHLIDNHRFFSCIVYDHSHSYISVGLPRDHDCFEVEMYLLPYNKTTGRPVEGSYELKEGYGWTTNSTFSSSYVYMKLNPVH